MQRGPCAQVFPVQGCPHPRVSLCEGGPKKGCPHVPMQRCPHARGSLCRGVPVHKSSPCKNVPTQGCPHPMRSLCECVPVKGCPQARMSPCRGVPMQVPAQGCPRPRVPPPKPPTPAPCKGAPVRAPPPHPPAGDYEVSIKFNEEHIPDSPFVVPVASHSDDARRLTVTSLQVPPDVPRRPPSSSSLAPPKAVPTPRPPCRRQ